MSFVPKNKDELVDAISSVSSKELVIENPFRIFSLIYPSLILSIYFFLMETSILWFIILILTLVLATRFLTLASTQLICRLDKKALFFPSIGRQIDLDKIDFMDISESYFMRAYVVQVYTKDIYNEVVKFRVPNRMALRKTVAFMESAGVAYVEK